VNLWANPRVSIRLWVVVAIAAPRMPDERRPTNWPPIEIITPPIST
jgi:hypothetical protein